MLEVGSSMKAYWLSTEILLVALHSRDTVTHKSDHKISIKLAMIGKVSYDPRFMSVT